MRVWLIAFSGHLFLLISHETFVTCKILKALISNASTFCQYAVFIYEILEFSQIYDYTYIVRDVTQEILILFIFIYIFSVESLISFINMQDIFIFCINGTHPY